MNEQWEESLKRLGKLCSCAVCWPETEKKIVAELTHAKEAGREEEKTLLRIALEETYSGSPDGYHGYLVLPDCEKENHGKKCARCLLSPPQQI